MEILDLLEEKGYSLLTSSGYFSYESGIKPLIEKINGNKDFFKDMVVADKIVGKASACLMIKAKVKEVYALVLSNDGENVLKKHNIKYHYKNKCDYIINRKKDGMCPMEALIKDIDDVDEAYSMLNKIIFANK